MGLKKKKLDLITWKWEKGTTFKCDTKMKNLTVDAKQSVDSFSAAFLSILFPVPIVQCAVCAYTHKYSELIGNENKSATNRQKVEDKTLMDTEGKLTNARVTIGRKKYKTMIAQVLKKTMEKNCKYYDEWKKNLAKWK